MNMNCVHIIVRCMRNGKRARIVLCRAVGLNETDDASSETMVFPLVSLF